MSFRRSLLILAVLVSLVHLFSILPCSAQSCETNYPGFATCPDDQCTVVMVGKKASTDGSVISIHTRDCGFCDCTWRYVPPADHAPGATRKIYYFDQYTADPPSKGLKWDAIEDNFNGLEIPQVSHTYGYLHGAFGYMNDNQVALGESTLDGEAWCYTFAIKLCASFIHET
jgi:hypothetical protein